MRILEGTAEELVEFCTAFQTDGKPKQAWKAAPNWEPPSEEELKQIQDAIEKEHESFVEGEPNVIPGQNQGTPDAEGQGTNSQEDGNPQAPKTP